MGKLENWDFRDIDVNSKTQLINRQKSSLNLEVLELDQENKKGTFCNKKNGEIIEASLEGCECHDFNFAGNSPRKTFTPCMHIYRLAIELCIMKIKYIDRNIYASKVKMQEILTRFPYLKRDPTQWGGWGIELHNFLPQEERQYRAYEIINNDRFVFDTENREGIIHGYKTNLECCSCPDFSERQLPCKHIYCLALLLKIRLALSPEKYQKQKDDYKMD